MKRFIHILAFSAFVFWACDDPAPLKKQEKQRQFPGFHPLMEEIVRSKDGVFRGLNLNASAEQVRTAEPGQPVEENAEHLYYEYVVDSTTSYSIDYSLESDTLQEISIQISMSDLDLSTYLFCDLRDYYANKLPNPTEDQGYVVYNCFVGERKPFVVSLSDNSTPNKGIISIEIYKDQ